jgi:hypothetical protein
MLHALTGWFFRPRRLPARPSRKPTRFRPRLEALEDRSLPSATIISGLPVGSLPIIGVNPPAVVPTSLDLTSSVGATARFGQKVTFTADVTPASWSTLPLTGIKPTPVSWSNPAPTGTVVFYVDGKASATVEVSSRGVIRYDSIRAIDPLPIWFGGGAWASWSTSTLPIGRHTITATYSGDDHFAGSSAQALTLTVAPRMTLTSSALSTSVGQPVTLTATVAAPGGPAAPTGTLDFFANGVMIGSSQLQPGADSTSSASTLDWTPTAAGVYSITVSYAGDSNYVGRTADLTSHGHPVRLVVTSDGVVGGPIHWLPPIRDPGPILPIMQPLAA